MLFLDLFCAVPGECFHESEKPLLPNFDRRREAAAVAPFLPAARRASGTKANAGLNLLRQKLPTAEVTFDPLTVRPRWVVSRDGFLSGLDGAGRAISPLSLAGLATNDPHRALQGFLREHRALFGHGPEALAQSRIAGEAKDSASGLRMVLWQQQLDGIDVFEGLLQAHTTRREELVSVSGGFVVDAAAAARRGQATVPVPAAGPLAQPRVSAAEAVAAAATNVGEQLGLYEVAVDDPTTKPQGAEHRQFHRAGCLNGPARSRLVWLPMNAEAMRLCWEILLTSRARGEMFRLLVDAETGDVLVRHSLTAYVSPVTYRVFTGDSPSPFSPGHAFPSRAQPPVVPRQLVTLEALNTNASPNGWISEGENETRGNNADAHTDWDGDDIPDLPRPQGSPFRVFDFPMDLGLGEPRSYSDAAVTQLFYWVNWMHDRLYELGFDEAAGNFQVDNFGRGGEGNDAVLADAQDGSGLNNSNMSTPPDGTPARMQMYLFDGPSPDRDSALDAELVLHEYTHGLTTRRVGGGVGLYELQSAGLGEGWSDFYALALLAQPGDDLDGVYAAGAYTAYRFRGLEENYYFGIRRYPYCTDPSKNPLTFRDLDPQQADGHPGIPRNTLLAGPAVDEVHNQGEIWCLALWEVRANLLRRHGFSVGNPLMLRLVTLGLSLLPPNPNFLEARDGVLQADRVLTGGVNQREIWSGFAKRGMGLSAAAPSSDTTVGVREAFDLPEDLSILPFAPLLIRGPAGGPFQPGVVALAITNAGTNAVVWSVHKSADWLRVRGEEGGTLAGAGTGLLLPLELSPAAYFLAPGIYEDQLVFSNRTTGIVQTRSIRLGVGEPDHLTEFFEHNDQNIEHQTLTFTPDGSERFYSVCREPASAFPTDPRRGRPLALADNGYAALTLAGAVTISLYGQRAGTFIVTANGCVAFDVGNFASGPSLAEHFREVRLSGFFADLDPSRSGVVSWQQLPDRVAVSFENVTEAGQTNSNSFQMELFYDGRIRLTHLRVDARYGLVGLSRGLGVPAAFLESDFNAYEVCAPILSVVLPPDAREGNGTLTNAGCVLLPAPAPVPVTVSLDVNNPAQATVPSSIIIPTGGTNVCFDVTILDDESLDGPQTVVIQASAPGYAPGAAAMHVHDNEPGLLTVELPRTASEDAGRVSGSVTVPAAVAEDVVVTLVSSQPLLLSVPASVVLPRGSSSTVFTATLTDDRRINGSRSVLVTAQVPYWTTGVATLEVLDNETLELGLVLPARVREGAGVLPQAGSLVISGVLDSNLTVSLYSEDTQALTVPSSVTVVAGQTSATFDLSVPDDSVLEADRSVTVVARAAGWTEGRAAIQVSDDETPPVPIRPRPPHQALQIPVTTDLSWVSPEEELLMNGDFEEGNLSGWRTDDQGTGQVKLNDGRVDPRGPDGPLSPFEGRFSVLTDQLGRGRHVLYQDVSIPLSASAVTLSWAHRIRNHAENFTAQQGFRVEIRRSDNTVRAVAFTTQRGDRRLQEWSEHQFDLAAYRGQTIRLAFVEEDSLNFLNAHVDKVSVRVAPTVPTVFDVFFGTNPSPGPGERLGSTTNGFWDLPVLRPQTTYFWKVTARRLGEVESPVWQFTTRGVDHFGLTPVGLTQHVSVPFPLTVTALDELGQVVSNFSGNVDFQLMDEDAPASRTLLGEPPVGLASVPNDFTYGYAFTPGVDLLVTHLRRFSGAKVTLWTDSGRLLTSLRFPGPGGVWEEARLPSPLHLRAGLTYRLGVHAAESGLAGKFDLGSTFPDGTLDRAWEGSGDVFPTLESNWRWPFVDLRYQVASAAPARITPFASAEFVNGSWSGSLTPLDPVRRATLQAEDGEGHTGQSSPFTVRGAPGVFDHYAWGPIPSPQWVNTPFPVTLTALDSLGLVITNYNGAAHFNGRIYSPPTAVGPGTNRSVYPLATFFERSRQQVIYLASELGPAGSFSALSLHVALPPGQPLEGWTVRLQQTSMDHYADEAGWETGGWTTGYSGPATIAEPGWMRFPFREPFFYDGRRNLLVDFILTNALFSTDGECWSTPTDRARAIARSSDDLAADPAAWSGREPLPDLLAEVPNVLFEAAVQPVAVSPAAAGVFVEGVWSGVVSVPVPIPAPDLRLVATVGDGYEAESDPFSVQVRDDLVVSLRGSTDPAPLGESFTLTACVSNTGPSVATGVMLDAVLPGDCGSVQLLATPGSCHCLGGVWRCDLGRLDAGASAQVGMTWVPTAAGFLASTVTATRAEADFYLPNNTATNLVEIQPRRLFVETRGVAEGDAGWTVLNFHLHLSLPGTAGILLPFATQDRSARAGVDYLATNGSVLFEPGITERDISVVVLGDRAFEPDETLLLHFPPALTNIHEYADAIGTIRNDDARPSLRVGDGGVVEGDAGMQQVVFRLELSAPQESAIDIHFNTLDETAVAGRDYVETNGTVSIPSGAIQAELAVNVLGDTEVEFDELFRLEWATTAEVQPGYGAAVGRILTDDLRPVIVAGTRAIQSETTSDQVLEPGEKVTLQLQLLNWGNMNTTDLVATLLPGDGVAAPEGPVSYGVLSYHGPGVTRPFTFTVNGTNGGVLVVRLRLQDGGASLGEVNFRWPIGRVSNFRIAGLGTNECQTLEHRFLTGLDRGGIAVSDSHVFYTGDAGTARFALTDLSGGAGVGRSYEVLVSDLRTEKVYALASGSSPISGVNSSVTTLLEIDGASGALTTNAVILSHPILMQSQSGIFAGLREVVVLNGAGVFRIDLPSGLVTDLGPMPALPHTQGQHWAFWGVEENHSGGTWLAYVRDTHTIVRTRVPDGLTLPVASFENLGDMCGFTVSLALQRWYFHHTGVSQFRAGDQTLGFCSAAFELNDEPRLDHFEWSTIPAVRLAGNPIAVAVTARDFVGRLVSTFQGAVALSAVPAVIPSTRTLLNEPAFVWGSQGDSTLGYAFRPNTDLTVTHVRHSGGGKVSIWTDAGLLLASRVVPGNRAGAWNETPLAVPLVLRAGVRYRVGYYTGGGGYYYRFDLPEVFADGLLEGSYQADGDRFPDSADSVRWWFVDLRYAPGTYPPLPVTPDHSSNFSAGVWSGGVTVGALGTNVVLRGDDGAGHAGASNPFRLIGSSSGRIDHFVWEPIPSPQSGHVPFAVTLSARDEMENRVADYRGVAVLNAEGLHLASFHLRDAAEPSTPFLPGNYTLGYSFTPTNELLVTHLRRYSGTKVSLWAGNRSLLVSQKFTNEEPGWAEEALGTPITLPSNQRYVIGFQTGDREYFWRQENTNSFRHGSIDGSVYAPGDRFPDNPFAEGWWLVGLRYTLLGRGPIPVLPTNRVELIDGNWAGDLSLPILATNIILSARDPAGYAGESNPFHTVEEAVRLVIARGEGEAVLSWTAWTPGYLLEAAPVSLTQAVSGSGGGVLWTMVTNVEAQGARYSVTNTMDAAEKFFRLRRVQP